MRTLRPSLCLLILPLGLLGCTSTARVRSGAATKIRTVASVGDKPLPVVSGEPGESVVAERVAPERRADLTGRISGRVVDESGEPVPNARVRLAVGGTLGGKVVRGKTDPSGAFTLRGLRPGSTYTLIAESEDEKDGLLSGRSEARAPDSNVRISLAPDDAEASAERASTRVSPISNRDPADDDAETKESRPSVNEEDLPPAAEADALTPSRPARSVPPARESARWKRGEPARTGTQTSESQNPAPVDPEARGTSLGPADSAADDDGVNPLPPALEPERTSAQEVKTGLKPLARSAPATKPKHAGRQPPGDAPGSLVVVRPTDEPIDFDQSLPSTGASKPLQPRAELRRRPTWGEIASNSPKEPERESPRTKPDGEPGARAAQDLKETCRFDARNRRIVDFRLPDVEGRPVRFQDLGADYVLLDFWGTWCQPCLNSVPHLVELQKRLGAPSLRVVGVACEHAPDDRRAAKVAETVKRLAINYPVLLSDMDGSSPLQEVLHIKAYPTLILVDRQGYIVWREEGAERLTLARLDRVLASATRSSGPRRF